MIYTPTHTQLAEIGKRLDLPTIPPEPFLSALIDVYSDFLDVEYNDIIIDINAGYLTFHSDKPIDTEIECSDSKFGYLWYYDGSYENLIGID